MPDNTDNSQFNPDELVPPKWLDTNFVAEVLRAHEKSPQLKVTDLNLSPACLNGDHYASIMFRAKAKYSTEKGDFEKSLVIKTMPEEEGQKKELIGSSPIFKTEVRMYSEVLPEFERILRQAGDNTKLFADCLYYSLEPHQVLIFEDLMERDYFVVRDRESTLDEVQRAYFKLAKWHAASLRVQQEQPDLLKGLNHGLFEIPNIMQEPFLENGISYFVELLNEEPELREYKPFFESIRGDFIQRLSAEWKDLRNNPRNDPYWVLCHGDFHLRNMMFQYQKGSFADCMLLDFQLSSLFPLTMDLVYSIYQLLEPEYRWKHWEDMMNYYYFVFEDVLKRIGYKGEMPTQSGFWQRLHQHKYYEFFLVSTFLPMQWALRDKSVVFIDILENEQKRKNLYFSQGYIKDVKILLARFEKLGYFKDIK
ncbi:uncharacterized protein [Drosophila kikkawai]|uniref:CHK kinase-like domain-containing protein n=1 Tax=Drosophila kikkawai TaxID=30033 RepID=A0A6P4HSF1_DROKI|nr:uncharacterized protein LOC108072016 [Drosophila kikkawai]